ncbi:uncharacterized protein TNIN_402881 [Trichonephila inaurata madagascariensis]|uniref:Uncharacterized protein n=1 Tax=Trichonephila inaurata madagascariensis TaxID=2747483 RepID=A0A8X6IC04_9ARAC|nr:uncharacterized protein TNIN_402881 [Trichonephila inaurata madagascariensis]
MKYEERPLAASLYSSDYKLNDELSSYSKPSIDSDKGFRLLKKIFIFFSINLFDTEDSKFKKIRNLLRLAFLMHIFIIYLVLVEIRSYARLKTPIGLNISLSSGTIIVVILRIILLKQATLVRKTLKTSYEMLYTISKSKNPSVLPSIYYRFAICFIVSLLFIVIFIFDTCSKASIHIYQDYFFFGWIPDYNDPIAKLSFNVLTSIMECMEVITLYIFPSLALILCSYQFSIIYELNKAVARRIKNSSSLKNAMEEYLTLYADVEFVMKTSERAISSIVFFVYAYILSCLFQVTGALVTLFLSKAPISRNLILFSCCMLLLFGGVASFLSLSVQTARINHSALLVRRKVFALLSKTKGEKVDFGALYVLLLIADNYPKQVVVTGWGFFPLDGHFVLKAVGGIITYAVIMIQISSY